MILISTVLLVVKGFISPDRLKMIKLNHYYSSSSIASSSSSKLYMHGSHGHSHAHHEHEHEEDTPHQEFGDKTLTSFGKAKLLTGRPLFRSLFVGVITLLPALAKRRVHKQDLGIFVIGTIVFWVYDNLRSQSKNIIQKVKNTQNKIVKHTTPLTRKYFFKNDNAADRVTLLGVVINILLSVSKFWAGMVFHSAVLIADAGHSLSDLFSDFVTLWAVQIARLPPDDDHPYGHQKFEAVGSLFLAMTLIGTGFSIGSASYHRLLEVIAFQRSGGVGAIVEIPTGGALIMALLSIWSKEWLFRVTKRVGTALNSQVVIANAWHHRSDAFSSILAFVSIALAMTLPSCLALDAGAGILIAGMICITGGEILSESVQQLTDASDGELEQRLKQTIVDGDIASIDMIRTRMVGSSALVDVHISILKELSSSATKAVEERLRWKIIEAEPSVLDGTVTSSTLEIKQCPVLLNLEGVMPNHSAAEVEELSRDLLQSHSSVKSVEKVTLHYYDTIRTRVDANIKMNDQCNTLTQAQEVATELRTTLLKADLDIDEANIFICVNPSPLQVQINSGDIFVGGKTK